MKGLKLHKKNVSKNIRNIPINSIARKLVRNYHNHKTQTLQTHFTPTQNNLETHTNTTQIGSKGESPVTAGSDK